MTGFPAFVAQPAARDSSTNLPRYIGVGPFLSRRGVDWGEGYGVSWLKGIKLASSQCMGLKALCNPFPRV